MRLDVEHSVAERDHFSNPLSNCHSKELTDLSHIDTTLVFEGWHRLHGAILWGVGQPRFRSMTMPPLALRRSAGAMANTSCQVPAAAQTSSYCNRSGSMKMRSAVL